MSPIEIYHQLIAVYAEGVVNELRNFGCDFLGWQVCFNFMGFDGEWEWCHYRDWHLLSGMMCETRVSSPGTMNIWPKNLSPSWWWNAPKMSKKHPCGCCYAPQWASMAPMLHNFVCTRDMLHNNLTNQRMRNLWKFLTNSIKRETPVCHNVLIYSVFQVFSDEGQARRSLLIMNVCAALAKHSVPLFHIWLIHYTFPICCNKLTINFNQMDVSCIQRPNYSSHFTIGWILGFLTHF